jgi:ubiquinone biosynthesis protein
MRSPLKQTIGDFRRFRQVITVLFEEGLSFLVDGLRLRYLVPGRRRLVCVMRRGAKECRRVAFGQQVDPPMEVRFRRAFERLGPTFVKLGQLLSLRPDIVPPEFIREFVKLQDSVKTLAPGVAEKIVERELGQPIENVFRDFDVSPLAAASLAQVHRATLKDGTAVAVKVQRPGIVETVGNDIHIFVYFAQLLEKYMPESRRYQPVRVAREFAEWTLRELDFEVEGANMDRFKADFKDDSGVFIPSVYWDFTTKAVLVMDLSRGVKIDDLDGLKRADIDRKEIALIGLRAGFREFFVTGFFHADPHPGNLMALPPPKGGESGEKASPLLCMHDFGMVGTLSTRSRFELAGCFSSFLSKDVDGYLRHITDLVETSEGADLAAYLNEVRTIITGVVFKPSQRKSVASSFYRVLLSAARHGIRFPTDLILLGRAFLTLESVGLMLYPEVDLHTELRPFLGEVLRNELSPQTLLKEAGSSAFDALYFIKRLPEQTRALLDKLEKGEVGVKIDLQELHDLKAEFDRQNDVRVLGVMVAALFVAAAVAMRLDQKALAAGISLGQLGFAISIVLTVWIFILVRRRPIV